MSLIYTRFYFLNKVKQILHYLAWRPTHSKVRQLSVQELCKNCGQDNNAFLLSFWPEMLLEVRTPPLMCFTPFLFICFYFWLFNK